MTTVIIPETLERLTGYLVACGGSDRFEFHDGAGDPDPLRARDFAEELRSRYAVHLDHGLEVSQSANRVTVRIADPV